jgi:hypothetical protein
LLEQVVSTWLTPNTGTHYSSATTASTGCSTSTPIFVLSQVISAFASIWRYIQTSSWALRLTHLITSDVWSTIYWAVIWSFIYVCWSDGWWTARLYRYSTTDLTWSTLMTISWTAITRDVGWFSDGTQLYNVYTNWTARIYTISGTTATSWATVNYTSSISTHAYWCDGTSVYASVAWATYKWALAWWARTTWTVTSVLSYYTTWTALSANWAIFKEAWNTTNIITAFDSSSLVNTTRQIKFIPVTTF